MRAFRSLILPLKAILLNLLAIGAAYGLLVIVFKWGGGSWIGLISFDQIEGWIPVFLFAMLFGLSMDYEVFLVSRMREEWDSVARQSSSPSTRGLAKTGRIVTVAGLIMVAAFIGFVAGLDRRPPAVRLRASRPRSSSTSRSCARCSCRADGDVRPVQLVAVRREIARIVRVEALATRGARANETLAFAVPRARIASAQAIRRHRPRSRSLLRLRPFAPAPRLRDVAVGIQDDAWLADGPGTLEQRLDRRRRSSASRSSASRSTGIRSRRSGRCARLRRTIRRTAGVLVDPLLEGLHVARDRAARHAVRLAGVGERRPQANVPPRLGGPLRTSRTRPRSGTRSCASGRSGTSPTRTCISPAVAEALRQDAAQPGVHRDSSRQPSSARRRRRDRAAREHRRLRPAGLDARTCQGTRETRRVRAQPYPTRPGETPLARRVRLLRRDLDGEPPPAARRRCGSTSAAKPIWLTEYGYQTNPPDRLSASRARCRRVHRRVGDARIPASAACRLLIQYLVRDEPRLVRLQTGLFDVQGCRSPASRLPVPAGAGGSGVDVHDAVGADPPGRRRAHVPDGGLARRLALGLGRTGTRTPSALSPSRERAEGFAGAGLVTGGPRLRLAAARSVVSIARREGRHPRRRLGYPAPSADADHQQAPAADLRPADGHVRDRGARPRRRHRADARHRRNARGRVPAPARQRARVRDRPALLRLPGAARRDRRGARPRGALRRRRPRRRDARRQRLRAVDQERSSRTSSARSAARGSCSRARATPTICATSACRSSTTVAFAASSRSRRTPPSEFAVTGVYFYDDDGLRRDPDARRRRRAGELEITDVNNHYVSRGDDGVRRASTASGATRASRSTRTTT